MARVTVLGAGSWGTTLGLVLHGFSGVVAPEERHIDIITSLEKEIKEAH